jgi:hypothetical protein
MKDDRIWIEEIASNSWEAFVVLYIDMVKETVFLIFNLKSTAKL